MRAYARQVHSFGPHTERVATGQYTARNQAASEWEGEASEAFQRWAAQQGRDGDALAQLFPAVARAVDAWCGRIDTVKSRMEQAEQVAQEGQLKVLTPLIYPPKPLPPASQDISLPGKDLSPTPEEAAAAKLLEAKQEAAFTEARETVRHARHLERNAHEKLVQTLTLIKENLKNIPQSSAWEQTGALPTSPAAEALANAATLVENRAAEATKGMFEQAIQQGPAATQAMWTSLSAAQQTDLIDRYPQMVGNTNGVPILFRDQANRRLLPTSREEVLRKLNDVRQAQRQISDPKDPVARQLAEKSAQLNEALKGIRDLETHLTQSETYLIGFDPTADSRGRAIVANGDPDTAQHVLTYVPGTFSDLGGVNHDLANNRAIFDRAQQLAPEGQKVATIVWEGYESPPNLGEAGKDYYANNAKQDLSEFQQGLRVTHDGAPSHNTVLGHSYGSTVVGYAARDHGLHTDDIAFLGSPGVGVDNAHDLGVPPERVWAGTSEADSINSAGPPEIADRLDGVDDQWFGVSPSDPTFDGNVIPTDPTTAHSDYWKKPQTVDELARIVSGQKDVQR
ncbi:alpha/beta hydrolase [Saccharopolyspora sp. 5N708]|uniref:alpha/beta hydrolase n=1 Tax=Saccharopolyspora sp. 5N708 TaxID=3457424 RepID=UPI003FD481C3